MKSKTLLTGGSGLLGTEIQRLVNVHAPSHKQLDFTKCRTPKGEFDLIIHSGAYTDVVKAETERMECFNVNVNGTFNLLLTYPGVPFVYISSEYAKKPVNHYSWTKKIAEDIIKTLGVGKTGSPYLIIRTLFKPVPFPHKRAFVDQWTRGDEVTIIAPLIIRAIRRWNKITNKLIYVGTGRKRIIDIARKSRPDVGEMWLDEVEGVVLPKSY